MSGQCRKLARIWPAALFSVIILAAVVISAGCKKQPAEQTNTEHQQEQRETSPVRNSKRAKHIQQKANISNGASLSLNDVIRFRRYWDPAFISWYGKTAPDFTLADITGKQHKLSDYRGKDVMIILWATWCRPCIIEIPHLIELRNTTNEDKLAMLAISYITPPNTTEMVKSMVEQRKINYTVISVDVSNVSAPYNQTNSIPCSIFIDPEGKIKLATVGVLHLNAIKAILQAK